MDERIQATIHEALRLPVNAIAYTVSSRLKELFPGRAIVESASYAFDVEEYIEDCKCTGALKDSIHNQIETRWSGRGYALSRAAHTAWYAIEWQSHALDVLLMTWESASCSNRSAWILAESQAIAEDFFRDVCEWTSEVRGEVLVFDAGYWMKNAELYHAIKNATFDNLILPGDLSREIQNDFEHFLQSREVYEKHRVPWKRGVLFIGPPGNGKTHTVKALINKLGQPCLYVKSFTARFHTEHDSIREVFKRARETTPCVLVLEDLDSLLTDKNRSFFLNELDGFAANTGIITLATTNHPERLDPAILERPSRFDRKYHFDLPGRPERERYIALWNDQAEPSLRLTPAAIATAVDLTEGFSYAYLKELFLSAMMRWIADPRPGCLDVAVVAQAGVLREQMTQMLQDPAPELGRSGEEEED